MEPSQQGTRSNGLTHGAMEAIAAIGIFAIGVVMMVDNYRIGAGWAPDGPESGYFPFRIGAILCFASVVVLFQSVVGKQRSSKVFVSWERFRRVLMVLLPTAVYVLAIQFVGMYVASTFFIAAFMRAMDKSGWLKTVLVAVGVNAMLFWMFEIQFTVPLRKGPLEALFGY